MFYHNNIGVSMKYIKKRGQYEGSNVTYDPISGDAYSYGWWRFVERINGKVVFNNYSYSPSTSRHQWKVRSLLNQLGVKIDITLEAREGLQNLHIACNDYYRRIEELTALINKPRTRKSTNERRRKEIEETHQKIKTIIDLKGGDFVKYSAMGKVCGF